MNIKAQYYNQYSFLLPNSPALELQDLFSNITVAMIMMDISQ